MLPYLPCVVVYKNLSKQHLMIANYRKFLYTFLYLCWSSVLYNHYETFLVPSGIDPNLQASVSTSPPSHAFSSPGSGSELPLLSVCGSKRNGCTPAAEHPPSCSPGKKTGDVTSSIRAAWRISGRLQGEYHAGQIFPQICAGSAKTNKWPFTDRIWGGKPPKLRLVYFSFKVLLTYWWQGLKPIQISRDSNP